MQTFTSDCTTPPEGVAFVGAPRIRGTLNIAWGCALVLIACTCSVLHLNVPVQSTLQPGKKGQKYRRMMLRAWIKVKWMLIKLIAPEYVLGKAFSDYLSVKRLEDRFKTLGESDEVPWTATHTHFANMGGFAIKFKPAANSIIEEEEDHASSGMELQDRNGTNLNVSISTNAYLEYSALVPAGLENSSQPSLETPLDWKPDWMHYTQLKEVWRSLDSDRIKRLLSPKKSHLLRVPPSKRIGEIDWEVDHTNAELVDRAVRTLDMCRFRNEAEFTRLSDSCSVWARNLACLKGNPWILDANQLLMARELGIIDKLPFLASDDLDDRNKQDIFLKLLALGQISWFIFEIGLRLYKHLHISLLEVMVLAFSLCTVITYVLLLDKPNNATYTITVPAARRPQTAPDMTRLALVGPCMSMWGRRSLWIPNNAAAHLDYALDGSAKTRTLQVTAQASAASAFMFGGVHFIAWNFKFFTPFEKVMWHASSVITAFALPIGYIFNIYLGKFIDKGYPKVTYILFGVPYVAARIFILVEVVRSLAYLPSDVFIAT